MRLLAYKGFVNSGSQNVQQRNPSGIVAFDVEVRHWGVPIDSPNEG